VPNADPAAQRTLLEIAGVDRAADTAAHRRTSLPDIAVIADGTARIDELTSSLVLARTEVGDLDRAARTLDDEVESVRARADRDNDRLTSGAVPAKEAQGLQQELDSLARRQATFEDQELELMERRETVDATVRQTQSELDAVRADVDAATTRRDDAVADIDDELGRLAERRTELVAAVPMQVLAIYDRLRGQDKTGAGALAGDRCGACRMALDKQTLSEIHGLPPEAVPRCPEWSAILVRA
jgi:predicted  nucleic acid-binding Zn-ribbon protein